MFPIENDAISFADREGFRASVDALAFLERDGYDIPDTWDDLDLSDLPSGTD